MMKKSFLFLLVTLALVSILSIFSIAAFDGYTEVYNADIAIDVTGATVNGQNIKTQDAKGETALFLPSSTNLEALILNITSSEENAYVYLDEYANNIFGAKSVNLKNIATYDAENSAYRLCLRAIRVDDDAKTIEYNQVNVKICKSENINTMHISFADPAYGRAWIDLNKANDAGQYTTIKMYMANKSGEKVYDGKLTSIKGRGNSSFLRPKKPYQIKLDKKTDLLQSGNDANKCKTWILIANAIDKTMIKNPFAFDIGKYFGLEATPEYTFSDVYFDGVYRGTYLVCEKVQINTGRVEINDLEDVITTTDKNAKATDVNKYGLEYQYNPTSSVPEGTDISGGYLLEQDPAFYRSENSWFRTIDGITIVLKNPEFATKEMVEYVSERYYEMANAAKYGSFNDKKVEECIDIDSLATCYLVNEYMFNVDYQASSTYFFLPEAGNDKYQDIFYAGPLWDFDTSLGNRTETPNHFAKDPTYIHLLNRLYYRTETVRKVIMQKAKQLESLYDIIYSEVPASRDGVRSWSSYKEEYLPAINMNFNLWVYDNTENTDAYPTYEENYNYALNFMKTRHAVLMPMLTTLVEEIPEPEEPVKEPSIWERIVNFFKMIFDFIFRIFN